jgi:hypothetical protein
VQIAKWQCVGTTSTKEFFSLKIALQEHWSDNAYIRGFLELHCLGANGMESNIQVHSTRNRKGIIFSKLLKYVSEVEFARNWSAGFA